MSSVNVSKLIYIGVVMLAFSEKIFKCAVGSSTSTKNGCLIPMSLPNGTYTVRGLSIEEGSLAPHNSILQLTCPSGYMSSNAEINFCDDTKNDWYKELATCQKTCKRPKSSTVEFTCTVPGQNGKGNRGSCDKILPSGTTATPKCQKGHHSITSRKNIFCNEGRWGYIMPSCKAECGKSTPRGNPNVINGTNAARGEFPWFVAIYSMYGQNITNPNFKFWCGGSIISRAVVISAAHCFYDTFERKALDTKLFEIAVGKLYSDFFHTEETDSIVQKSKIKKIEIPSDYEGELSSYSHDLALIILQTQIFFSDLIMPVCMNLIDSELEEDQTSPGSPGKVSGFGLTDVNGVASDTLKTTTMPIISKKKCKEESPQEFSKYIVWDKLCAGYNNGIGVCKGDSGGGLVVSIMQRNQRVWYLRGIVSTAPSGEDHEQCSTNTYSTFTKPFPYREFIEEVMQKQACTMPDNPPNGRFEVIGLKNAAPGEEVGHRTQITLKCETGFVPSDGGNNVCDEFIDDWTKEFSSCIVMPEIQRLQPTSKIDGCVFPDLPQYGYFSIFPYNNDFGPGDIVPPNSLLSINCDNGYGSANTLNTCDGETNSWMSNLAVCRRSCNPLTSLSVTFECILPDTIIDISNVQNCDTALPSETIAIATCAKGYNSNERLQVFSCEDGFWNEDIPVCNATCGISSVNSSNIMENDSRRYAIKGEFPWHASIYKIITTSERMDYLCGGTIISRVHIITAGHCFLSKRRNKIEPKLFTVVVGKLYTKLDDPNEANDLHIQKLEVKKIEIPITFDRNLELLNDLAIVVLETPINFSEYVMPICLDLQNLEFDDQQTSNGVLARVPGFGFEDPDGPLAPQLKAITMPMINSEDCNKIATPELKGYLAIDKICAGTINGTNLCSGDSGSALAVPHDVDGETRWYLRGAATLVPTINGKCDLKSFALFTSVLHNKYFIESVLNAPV